MTASPFKVIDGGAPAKPKRKPRSLTVWECRACEADVGVRSRSLVKVRQDTLQDGKLQLTGGRYIWVCAICLARGRFTPATA